jgi:hypothetical protein
LVVNKWNGWYDSPPGGADITPRPDAPGSYRGRNLRRAKRFTLECTGRSESPDTRELLIDKIVSILLDPDSTYPLVRNEVTRSLMIWVELDGPVVPVPLGNYHVRFVIPLAASDPYKYTDYNDAQSTPLPSPPTDGILWDGPAGGTGTQWDGPGPGITGWQYQTTQGVPGILKLTNNGTADAPIEFTISSTAVNPRITNIQTQQIIRIGTTVGPPSSITINTKTGRVMMDSVDITGLLTNSDFFSVPAKSFVDIAFSADPGSAGSILTARNANVFN